MEERLKNSKPLCEQKWDDRVFGALRAKMRYRTEYGGDPSEADFILDRALPDRPPTMALYPSDTYELASFHPSLREWKQNGYEKMTS